MKTLSIILILLIVINMGIALCRLIFEDKNKSQNFSAVCGWGIALFLWFSKYLL